MTGLAEPDVCIRSHNAISRSGRRKALLGKGMDAEVVERIVNQRVPVTVSPKGVTPPGSPPSPTAHPFLQF